ncbi:MAG: glycerol-3-phosphate dehydrogenase/oxidase [Bacteroidia bacterium]|nr:glycerol-3-phosphate dehydrogenase/oxidase [Bacteroidia bacterium]
MNQIPFLRDQHLAQLPAETFDLLVIGGGATGAGIALDAAARGLRVALAEKQDFAAGTSSRSTKLIHGGLRYLKQMEFKLVREVGLERATVHRLAPHLVVAEKMLLPLIKNGTYGRLMTQIGLQVYDILAGVTGSDRRVMLSAAQTLEKEPLLRADLVEGGGFYAEYRTDDARLVTELIKTAAARGAVCVNYLEVKDFIYEKGQVAGAICEDRIGASTLEIRARQVVNAAGPWVDELRSQNGSLKNKRLHLTKGVHIVVPHERLPLRQSVYFDVPDGRMLFAIPRGKSTYIGTTDTDYQGSKEQPLITAEDVQYLIKGTHAIFPSAGLTEADVVSSWAGLRPLIHEEGKSASELSRKDEIFISPSGLISIAGGKLTGYRKMAERVVNRVARQLQQQARRAFARCQTKHIVLAGGQFADAQAVTAFQASIFERLGPAGFTRQDAAYLVHNYGTQVPDILDLMEQPTAEGLVLAELAFGLEHEMVQTPVDFWVRRTGRLYFDIGSVYQHKNRVLEAMKAHFGWSDDRTQALAAELEQAIGQATRFPAQAEMVH